MIAVGIEAKLKIYSCEADNVQVITTNTNKNTSNDI